MTKVMVAGGISICGRGGHNDRRGYGPCGYGDASWVANLWIVKITDWRMLA